MSSNLNVRSMTGLSAPLARPLRCPELVEAPRPYPGIKQAKIATASAQAVVTSSAMVQIALIREGAPAAKPLPKLPKNIGYAGPAILVLRIKGEKGAWNGRLKGARRAFKLGG